METGRRVGMQGRGHGDGRARECGRWAKATVKLHTAQFSKICKTINTDSQIKPNKTKIKWMPIPIYLPTPCLRVRCYLQPTQHQLSTVLYNPQQWCPQPDAQFTNSLLPEICQPS